ncbi:methyltransferase domain-containing protein ['Catharanthus roseus' aster yellows phytoplasma]|uniref:Methyltransferase domain-containing protein n=1 Tax='Catharanthus roseus' aster yellows phytoplasma TaxID=1193712 RepID=A0A4P6MC90_9MOLU|nr:methyltransferase domain-containing protein ['Catharanthus roseus' aster yellows phytoplasma]
MKVSKVKITSFYKFFNSSFFSIYFIKIKKNLSSLLLVIFSSIILIWGVFDSFFQTHLDSFAYCKNIFHYTRQSIFLILVVAIIALTKYRTTKFYQILSFVALVNILIISLVFCDFIEDHKQHFISANWQMQLIPYYLQYVFAPLIYCFYVWKRPITFLGWKKVWIVFVHPFCYFLLSAIIFGFKADLKSHFINPYYQNNLTVAYFKLFVSFLLLAMGLIGVQKIKIHPFYKGALLVLGSFLICVIPRETSDWNHAKELVFYPQQMGSSLFPESQDIAKQLSNLVLEFEGKQDTGLKTGEKILELGAGSGNVTKYLVQKFGAQNVIALEYDKELCNVLRNKFPGLTVIEGDACNFIELLKKQIDETQIKQIKGIVSTLPLSIFSQEQLQELNKNLATVIKQNKIRFVEYRFLLFLREKHIIGDGVEEIQDTKNQIFVSSAILPTKVFIFAATDVTK